MNAGVSDVIEGRTPMMILRCDFIHFYYILINYACFVDMKHGILIKFG